jgi:hypothetical protein
MRDPDNAARTSSRSSAKSRRTTLALPNLWQSLNGKWQMARLIDFPPEKGMFLLFFRGNIPEDNCDNQFRFLLRWLGPRLRWLGPRLRRQAKIRRGKTGGCKCKLTAAALSRRRRQSYTRNQMHQRLHSLLATPKQCLNSAARQYTFHCDPDKWCAQTHSRSRAGACSNTQICMCVRTNTSPSTSLP